MVFEPMHPPSFESPLKKSAMFKLLVYLDI